MWCGVLFTLACTNVNVDAVHVQACICVHMQARICVHVQARIYVRVPPSRSWEVMMRVVMMSKGVVKRAAVPPPKAPRTASAYFVSC